MDNLRIETCGSSGFGSAGVLGSHQTFKGCARSKKPRRGRQNMGSSSGRTMSIPESRQHVQSDIPQSSEPIREGEEQGDDVFDLAQDESSPSSFDSTASLVHWIRSCNNADGLSAEVIDELLKLLFDPSFSLEKVSVKSVTDVESYGKFQ